MMTDLLFNLPKEKPTLIKCHFSITDEWAKNLSFKINFGREIDCILKEVYEPHAHWGEKRGGKSIKKAIGVIELPWDVGHWSKLNKLNTNRSAHWTLINDINQDIVDNDIDVRQFDFYRNKFGTNEFQDEFKRFLEYLEDNKNKLFLKLLTSTENHFVENIVKKIKGATDKGNEAEDVAVNYLMNIDNVTKVESHDGDGEIGDMYDGEDITFKVDGIQRSAQVKSGTVYEVGNDWRSKGIIFPKKYKTDLLIFVDRYYVYVFKNTTPEKTTKIVDGDLIIDGINFVRKIKKESIT